MKVDLRGHLQNSPLGFFIIISIIILFGGLVFFYLQNSPSSKAATCTWTGAIDTDWDNAGNWSGCGGNIPGKAAGVGDDVVFDGGTSNIDVDSDDNVSLGSFTVESDYTGEIDFVASADLTLSGDWTASDSVVDFAAGTTARFTGTGTQEINGSTSFFNLSISGSQTIQFQAGMVTKIQNGLTILGTGVGSELKIRSSIYGEEAYMVQGITTLISNVDVEDNFFFSSGVSPVGFGSSIDSGNTDGWFTAATEYDPVTFNSTVRLDQNTTNITLAGGDEYGYAISKIGDLNDDGVIDIAVGEAKDDTNGNDRGRVHIHFMNTDGSVDSSVIINDSTPNTPSISNGANIGGALEALGDLDGDGVEDLAVGVPDELDFGEVWILFLNTDGSVKSSAVLDSATTNGADINLFDNYGFDIANLGDLNMDGVIDIAVGAPRHDGTGGNNEGAVHIHFMNTDGSVDSTVEINDTTTNGPTLATTDLYGFAVENIGDLNTDGTIDIAVGALTDKNCGSSCGAVHIHFLDTDGSIKSSTEINSLTPNGPTGLAGSNEQYGKSIAYAEDLDQDNIQDIIVSAIREDGEGAFFVHYLTTSGGVSKTQQIGSGFTNGADILASDTHGFSIDAFDLTNDGEFEFFVTSRGYSNGAQDGAVFIHFLTAPPASSSGGNGGGGNIVPRFMQIKANDGAECTDDRNILLELSSQNAKQYRFGLDEYLIGEPWRPLAQGVIEQIYNLPNKDGEYTIYAQFRSASLIDSQIVATKITLDQENACEEIVEDEVRQLSNPFGPGTIPPGPILKGACPSIAPVGHECHSVYYYSISGQRHVFPNEKIFNSWYPNYDDLIIIDMEELRNIPLGVSIPYSPGSVLKTPGSPEVYIVAAGGVIHAFNNPNVAEAYLGPRWRDLVDDLDPGFLSSYSFGEILLSKSDEVYLLAEEKSKVRFIDQQLGLMELSR